MSARRKLNEFHVLLNVVIAALFGFVTASPLAFFVLLALLTVTRVMSGAIRISPSPRRRKK